MDSPFVLLKLWWRSRKPSRIADMPALRNTFWLRKGYDALTFFGTIVTATDEDALLMNTQRGELKNHEMIHLRQAQDTGDSWWRFYGLYAFYWLRALPLGLRMAYRLNPFEMEAYAHGHDLNYLERSGGVAREWRRWARLSPAGRLAWYKEKGLSAPSDESSTGSSRT